ncbi:hypothetical protein PoB_001092100 [Plakobranchus ocellatus]|uniref:Secreted protein n=1 Tax=Plakobranchus ocellatus TaxID=259542 RepID=A0AAV3YPT2_9GAST|nr:hypothetical protein PoB_001092100 [Plakobranchus ocellatus]
MVALFKGYARARLSLFLTPALACTSADSSRFSSATITLTLAGDQHGNGWGGTVENISGRAGADSACKVVWFKLRILESLCSKYKSCGQEDSGITQDNEYNDSVM